MKNAYAQLLKSFQQNVLKPANDAPGRLGIYQKAYRVRLIDVLTGDYPMLQKALGEEAFATLLNEYIDESPSRFRDLQDYSEAFADFVAKKHNSLPAWAGSLAEIERAQFRVLDAAPSPAFILSDTPDLATLLTLSLKAQKASESIASRHDLTPPLAGKPGEPTSMPITYFIYNDDGGAQTIGLEADEALAFALLDGRPLGEWLVAVYETLGSSNDFSPEKIQQWLFRWTSKRMVSPHL